MTGKHNWVCSEVVFSPVQVRQDSLLSQEIQKRTKRKMNEVTSTLLAASILVISVTALIAVVRVRGLKF